VRTLHTIGLAVVIGGVMAYVAPARAQGGAAQTHIGHVMDRFMNTPDEAGLLPTAFAEAQIAAQHAALAAKTPDNLNAMKLHAGHVLHAVDPSVETSGPGKGYGVKRAATGVAAHVGLAANAAGASANIKTHAAHVTASANTVVARCDEIVALVGRVRAAATAADAAPLAAQLSTLAAQLVSGVDANGDGSSGWDTPDGGVQQAQLQMELLRKGEGGH
jgi:hypothetical protein